jgi:hypothetical protein
LVFNIAQTTQRGLTHNPPMSQATWFRQKADECARQAKNASEPGRRDHYESQAEGWRLIAERIEAGERIAFGSDTAMTKAAN